MRRARTAFCRLPWPLVSALAGLSIALAGDARAVILPDIPLVWHPPVGARAAGMAGAYVAIADDYEALLHNPAALARVPRPEVGGAVERRSPEQEISYRGRQEVSKLTKTQVHSVGFAYPFPVYRGALVIGMAYDRAIPMNSEYFRTGAGGAVQSEEESIIEEGSVGAWTSGVAFDPSPTLSLGASGTILAGSSRRHTRFQYQAADNSDYEDTVSDTNNSDISAVTGTIGALLRPHPSTRFGIALHLPEDFTLEGRFTRDVRHYRETNFRAAAPQPAPGDTLDYAEDYSFEYKLKLPLRVSMGAAVALGGTLGGLTIAGQVDIADWTQLELAESTLRTDDREYAYRSVTDLRVGLEYARDLGVAADSRMPLRLRLGYALLPVPYRFVATDVFRDQSEIASFDPDRTQISAGLGLGVDPNTMLDAAWTRTSFERSAQSEAGAITRERVSENSILVGIRFQI